MAVKTPKAPKSHPDQAHLPTMEPERDAEIHAAAKFYRRVRDARMKASEAEKTGKDKLIETMKAKGCSVYHDPDGYAVVLNASENVKLQDEDRGAGPAKEE